MFNLFGIRSTLLVSFDQRCSLHVPVECKIWAINLCFCFPFRIELTLKQNMKRSSKHLISSHFMAPQLETQHPEHKFSVH